MVTMQIRNVSEDDHAQIAELARERGMSLQQFLADLIHQQAVIQRRLRSLARRRAHLAATEGGVSSEELSAHLAEERELRTEQLSATRNQPQS